MSFSQTQTVTPVAQRPLTATQSPSLPPQLPELPFLVAGPSSAHPPRLPQLPFSLRRSNAVRRSTATTQSSETSSQSSTTQTSIEYAAIPETANNKPHRRQSSVRNFSLPTYQTEQPRTMTRYYADALTSTDKAALARGDKNHNLKSWTPKDAIFYEELRKDLVSKKLYIGQDKKVCVIPVIVVTKGQNEWTHIRQLSHKTSASRSSSASSVSSPVSVVQNSVHGRAASGGSYFPSHRSALQNTSSSGSRVRSPLAKEAGTYKCNEEVSFDGSLAPHRSGKGEAYRHARDVKLKKAKRL